jgi:hypothetical protein
MLGENLIDSEKRKERRCTSRQMSQSLAIAVITGREQRRKRHRGISMLDLFLHGIYTMTLGTVYAFMLLLPYFIDYQQRRHHLHLHHKSKMVVQTPIRFAILLLK